MLSDTAYIEKTFTYQKPNEMQIPIYEELRLKMKELAYYIEAHCPNSREKSLAFTKLEECSMWANKAIALN